MSISHIVMILGFSWPVTLIVGLGEINTWRVIVATGFLMVSVALLYFQSKR